MKFEVKKRYLVHKKICFPDTIEEVTCEEVSPSGNIVKLSGNWVRASGYDIIEVLPTVANAQVPQWIIDREVKRIEEREKQEAARGLNMVEDRN